MCAGGLKHLVEQPAVEDSRVIAQLGRTFGLQGVVDEAKHNEQNPGRAITKAGINAALWYLGGEAGSALGGAGAGAAAGAGDESAGLAMNALQGAGPYADAASSAGGLLAGGGSTSTEAQLQQLAMENMSKTGLLGSGSPTVSTNNALQLGQAPVSDLSVQARNPIAGAAQDYAARLYGGARNMAGDTVNGVQGFAHGLLGTPAGAPTAEQTAAPVYDQSIQAAKSGMSSGTKSLASQMAMKMLAPQQRQPMPMAPPAPQGQQGPLSNPYQQSPYGPGGNSMGLTEEQKQKLRAMGYQVP